MKAGSGHSGEIGTFSQMCAAGPLRSPHLSLARGLDNQQFQRVGGSAHPHVMLGDVQLTRLEIPR